MARGLSETFMRELMAGGLSRLLDAVKRDHTLCLEIREGYINIYYRGGNLLKVTEKGGRFAVSGYKNYKAELDLPRELGAHGAQEAWLTALPQLKQAIDHYYTSKKQADEREAQQLTVRENNFCRLANGTDYYICDTEYASGDTRFDLVATKWPSTPAARKERNRASLAIIEMKYGDGALQGPSGLYAHLARTADFLATAERVAAFKEEMLTVFQQKHALGLIQSRRSLSGFDDGPVELIFLLAGHDPDSRVLRAALEDVRLQKLVYNSPPFELKFAVANFMGYGLYKENMYGYDDFVTRFL